MKESPFNITRMADSKTVKYVIAPKEKVTIPMYHAQLVPHESLDGRTLVLMPYQAIVRNDHRGILIQSAFMPTNKRTGKAYPANSTPQTVWYKPNISDVAPSAEYVPYTWNGKSWSLLRYSFSPSPSYSPSPSEEAEENTWKEEDLVPPITSEEHMSLMRRFAE